MNSIIAAHMSDTDKIDVVIQDPVIYAMSKKRTLPFDQSWLQWLT